MALGIERLIVAGYSMGGLIAQLCWRRHPRLTAGLVLRATARSIGGVPWARWVRLMTPALLMSAAAAGAMPGIYAFSSHHWIGEVDVLTAVIITRHDRVVSVARQGRLAATLLAACQAICSEDTEMTGPSDPAAGLTAS